ncbi:HAD family phosphatase [Thiomicrospira sp. ALE5]|uniref:histidinol-phosphatase n=1 Tax=Thiomicrospira sp. ALE5 TaxID=748650 RepID=UPI0008E682F9|nr:HAD family hydrolase [Thiomicrospira sp. ALE5]SFR50531.1 HAD-superfamily subfamily IB hydrolase, TIGR01490 [Thiomicrospira sp. ALE5]
MSNLTIFDLDNTLIGGDSDHLWGEFLIAKGLVDPADHKVQNDAFYQQYQQGNLDIFAYQRFVLKPLVAFTQDELAQLHQKYMAEFIEPIILPKAINLIAEHRDQGDTLMIITATNEFITRPIGQRLGIELLIGTQPEISNGRFTGEVAGIPSFQEGKILRLKQWLKTQAPDLTLSHFYSDSHNDLPLLKRVPYPVAVDPDEKLRSHAEMHDWPILSLRG